MAFWSGEKLAEELPNGLITPYDSNNLDYATYRLCVGEQAFVTHDKFALSGPSDPLISVLGDAPAHTLRIPPGQFAFLLTNEIVNVPPNAIGLISMRATYKFKGLINVSGFHVDPGWNGKLLFSVYNAGPSELIVKKGEPLFLIVFADLDRTSTMLYKGQSQGQKSINPALIQGMTSQVFSPLMLQRQMDEYGKSLSVIKEELSKDIATVKSVAEQVRVGAIVISIITTAVLAFVALLPNVAGTILAKTIESAGYEIKQKQSDNCCASKDSEAEKTTSTKRAIPVPPTSAAKP